ncbi:MAG: GHKL domain-containing protein [Candidatus Kapaibacterium sp.]|nr:MAG: GHKL domain-containing protein [Candidatus Kapabacteria bacterium]
MNTTVPFATALAAQLKTLPDLKNVPEEQLCWLINHSEVRHYELGEHTFKKGDAIDEMYIVLNGVLSIRLEQNGQFRELLELRAGNISGTLPFSRTAKAAGYGLVQEAVSILFLHKNNFRKMVAECYELTEALVHVMSTRVRTLTERQQQTDKMAALGRVSAGLAHELNNPSAAIVRSAAEFKKHLSNTPDRFKRVMMLQLDVDAVDVCNNLVFQKAQAGIQDTMTSLERADAEDELLSWLEYHNVDDGYHITGNFVDYGLGIADLEFVYEQIGEENFFTVLQWLDNVLTTERYVQEIGEASKRIHEIVSAVKSYSHLDRAAEMERTDIHQGIKNTFLILGHKIKKTNIKVVKNLDYSLPEVKIFVGELNQVWTNLLDNAIDALEGVPEPTLELVSRRYKEDFIEVFIIDNGTGIPEDALPNIFDPFFTTKPMGKGTGLGLHTVQNIIKQHNGDIKVESRAGRTAFRVCLPIG